MTSMEVSTIKTRDRRSMSSRGRSSTMKTMHTSAMFRAQSNNSNPQQASSPSTRPHSIRIATQSIRSALICLNRPNKTHSLDCQCQVRKMLKTTRLELPRKTTNSTKMRQESDISNFLLFICRRATRNQKRL